MGVGRWGTRKSLAIPSEREGTPAKQKEEHESGSHLAHLLWDWRHHSASLGPRFSCLSEGRTVPSGGGPEDSVGSPCCGERSTWNPVGPRQLLFTRIIKLEVA